MQSLSSGLTISVTVESMREVIPTEKGFVDFDDIETESQSHQFVPRSETSTVVTGIKIPKLDLEYVAIYNMVADLQEKRDSEYDLWSEEDLSTERLPIPVIIPTVPLSDSPGDTKPRHHDADKAFYLSMVSDKPKVSRRVATENSEAPLLTYRTDVISEPDLKSEWMWADEPELGDIVAL